MKKKIYNNKGYTLPEIMMASALMLISLGVILNTYRYSNRSFQAGSAQIIAQGNARKAFRKISSDIRTASSATIYNDYGAAPVVTNPGNYIEIDLPANPDVGYYYFPDGTIRFIEDLTADDPTMIADDIIIADNISGANIFQDNGGVISMAFSGFSTCSFYPGYHATDIGTYAKPRN